MGGGGGFWLRVAAAAAGQAMRRPAHAHALM